MPAEPEGRGSDRFPRDSIADRIERIATWVDELDVRVRAAEVATGDEKTAKELRRAIEALAKHDPKLEKRLTERVDVLAERLATLAETVSTTASSLARKDGELNALRKELEDGARRIESLARERAAVDSAELDKLRASVRAVEAERPARAADARVDGLAAKVGLLAERVDTLSKTVATTAAGLVGREGEIAALRQQLDAGSARIEQATIELRRMQGDGALAHRLEALRDALDEATDRLAARERDIAAVRSRIDEAYSRVGTVVAQMQTSIAGLSSQIGALETLPGATEKALATQAADLRERLDALDARLDSLASGMETASRGADEREAEIRQLDRRLDDSAARVDALASQVDDVLARLAEPRPLDASVQARLEKLDGSIAEMTVRLSDLGSASAAEAAEAEAHAETLERSLHSLGERIAALEHEHEKVAGQLEHAVAAWSEERHDMNERLVNLAAAQEATARSGEQARPLLDALASRVASIEHERTTMTAEIERVAAALAVEHETLHAQIRELAVASTPDAESDARERELTELKARVGAVEAARAALASETARVAADWSSALQAIEARVSQAEATSGGSAVTDVDGPLLEELAGRLDALERDRHEVGAWMSKFSEAWLGERSTFIGHLDELTGRLDDVETALDGTRSAPADDGLAQLRVAVEGMRMRLASNEQELAALVGTRDAGARLDELTRRLESLERAPGVVPAAGSAGDAAVPGDGRFRLELRALEFRIEHAEAAARDNREAVLVQLERLAARIEWRFQRLEEEYEARQPTTVGGGGQVVPLRPELGEV
jgi:chromosome segregation ATPase